ncbi:MAG: sugar porter family MFS transporter [Massilibacteroides sp.]|nr:sugar porter family MFS transporter [Massilibacteroides sp.]
MKQKKNTNIHYLLLISLVSAMGGLLFGYDWVVIGGAKIFYEPFFHIESLATMRGWAMSSALIGCLIGALWSGPYSDKYGRKKLLVFASFLFTASAIGTGAVDSFFWFICYRILGGFGIGIASNISPIYIAEVSPAKIRGRFVAINQLTLVIGILLAQVVNWRIGEYFLHGSENLSDTSIQWAWRYMFWAETIPAGLFVFLSFIIPESPQWLAINHKIEQAQTVFTKIMGPDEAKQALENSQTVTSTQKVTWTQVFKKETRHILVIGIILAVFQQWCGINVIFNYAHEIFVAAGYKLSDILMNIMVTGVTNVMFTFVAIFTVDKWGRRALMYIGSIGLTIIYAFMGLGFMYHLSGWPMLFLVVLAIACYAMSLAPIVWVILSEIFPARIRGAAMAISTFFLWVACFLLTYTFPLLNESLGAAGTFWTYGIICFLGFLFIRAYLPETKGKQLEEIEKELTK